MAPSKLQISVIGNVILTFMLLERILHSLEPNSVVAQCNQSNACNCPLCSHLMSAEEMETTTRDPLELSSSSSSMPPMTTESSTAELEESDLLYKLKYGDSKERRRSRQILRMRAFHQNGQEERSEVKLASTATMNREDLLTTSRLPQTINSIEDSHARNLELQRKLSNDQVFRAHSPKREVKGVHAAMSSYAQSFPTPDFHFQPPYANLTYSSKNESVPTLPPSYTHIGYIISIFLLNIFWLFVFNC
jgi:hypothetical protein